MPFVPPDLPIVMLFQREPLRALIAKHLARTEDMVDGIDTNELLVTPLNDLVAIIVSHNALRVPRLFEDHARMEQPVEFWNATDEAGNIIQARGFVYQLTLPFEGDSSLFFCTPEGPLEPAPTAKVFQKNVMIRVAGYDVSLDEVRALLMNTLSTIKHYLISIDSAIQPFMQQLEVDARDAISRRKERILLSRSIASSIGYPLRHREGDFVSHISTDVGRRIPERQAPRNNRDAFAPEPALDEKEYQHILRVLSDMTVVMERAPTAFKHLDEEDFRDFFLAVLNTHYEGNATGETFNKSGKTDILIRDNNRNVFIAECKIWRGRKSFVEAINQLLSYLSWRDTKAAVIIFNRNRGFSNVLAEVQAGIAEHPDLKTGPSQESLTRFRSVFGTPGDHNREITVTVMVFDVPA
jgi:hypothetical protein